MINIWSSYFKMENVIAVGIERNQDVSLESGGFNDQFNSLPTNPRMYYITVITTGI